MSYIVKSLENDEIVIARARYHWWFNLKSFFLLNRFNQVWVTDRRIVQRDGIIAVRTQSISLGQIESKDVEQSAWGRIFGFGDLIIRGSGQMIFRFEHISNPMAVSQAIGRAMVDQRGMDLDQVKSEQMTGTFDA